MINQERRNDKANRRLNQFMQDGKAFDNLQNIANIEINKLTPENKEKDESESTCHSERRSRWEANDTKLETSSRKTRNQRVVQREKLNRNINKQYEVYKSISPTNSACDSIKNSNENDFNDQNISINEMFNFRDLKNKEGMISIIKEKFTQIIRDLKYTYLSNANCYFVRENFFELKMKYSNNPKQLDLIVTDFFNKNIKDINEIFYQLEECYNSTIKSPEFIEKLIGPISKFFEEKNININFEDVLKEEFFRIILNDEFFKEIIQEIENRDMMILVKIKKLIKTIKEEFCQKHGSHCNNLKKVVKNNYKLKSDVVGNSSIISNGTITYSKTTTIHNKIMSNIVSPVNYSVKNNISSNENDYKNINDWVEYINSENITKQKKNKKRKNLSIKRKNKKIRDKTSDSKSKMENIIKAETYEIDWEIEEFRRKIKNQSIKANQIQKILPQYSEKWLKLLKKSMDN